jgi:hypothetical protein
VEKLIGFKADKETSENIKNYCQENNLTKTEFLKSAVKKQLTGNNQDDISKILRLIFLNVSATSKILSKGQDQDEINKIAEKVKVEYDNIFKK